MHSPSPFMLDISSEQFAQWLFQGLGRAYVHLQTHDSVPYHAALLQACLYNDVYDRQSTGTRTPYLHRLLELTGALPTFQSAILASFAAPDDAMDLEQLFDFALLFAQGGDPQSRSLMYDQFSACVDDNDDTGATHLIDLDGVQGFRFVAARLGEVAQRDPHFWDSNRLVEYLKEQAAGAVTDVDIAALAATDPSVQRYLDVVAETEATRAQVASQRQDIRMQSYTQVRAGLLERLPKLPYMSLRRWGKSASDEELQAAARDLLQCDEPRLLAAYMSIFTQRRFPLGFEPLVPLARHPNDRVARRALQALSLFNDPALRLLGFELIHERWHIGDALELFILNYQTGDGAFFISMLETASTPDEVHALSYKLLALLKHNAVPEACTLLCMLYEQQPCSLCRADVMQQLIATQSMPDWMLRECHYDTEEETQHAVALYEQQYTEMRIS